MIAIKGMEMPMYNPCDKRTTIKINFKPIDRPLACKDCFYYNIDEDGRGYHCEKYGHTRFPVYADFYCADAERRK